VQVFPGHDRISGGLDLNGAKEFVERERWVPMAYFQSMLSEIYRLRAASEASAGLREARKYLLAIIGKREETDPAVDEFIRTPTKKPFSVWAAEKALAALEAKPAEPRDAEQTEPPWTGPILVAKAKICAEHCVPYLHNNEKHGPFCRDLDAALKEIAEDHERKVNAAIGAEQTLPSVLTAPHVDRGRGAIPGAGEAPGRAQAAPVDGDLAGHYLHALLRLGELASFVREVDKKGWDKYDACIFCSRHRPIGHSRNCPLPKAIKVIEETTQPPERPARPVIPEDYDKQSDPMGYFNG
jgi:hypothetical protein